MKQLITIREANQHLSRYVDDVQDGAEIIITRRGLPVAKLSAFVESTELESKLEEIRNAFEKEEFHTVLKQGSALSKEADVKIFKYIDSISVAF